MYSPTPYSRSTPRLFQPPRRHGVLTQVAGMLRLKPAEAMWLGSSRIVASQDGIAWRLQFESGPAQGRSRPCVQLPVTVTNLDADALLRLLTEQSRLLAEHSLYLGVSPEGCIELTSMQWFDRPSELLNTLQRTMSEVGKLLEGLRGTGTGR